MPKSVKVGDASGLHRLPPGRHGLERDFVVRNQRDRLTAGVIAVVGERGYREATISQICAAAGVSRRTFYGYFDSKEECFGEAFDRITEHLDGALREAVDRENDWPVRVRARLEVLLGIFAANPDILRFSWIAPLRAGDAITSYHQLALENLLRALCEDKPSEGLRQPSQVVEHAVAGGMMALMAARVESGGGSRLPDLLPDLLELFLTPYLGRAEAVRAL
ncbi:MAG TPA: TetR/AcrR family transcriptional regulator [Solirubrobacterales bacterium]|nr:TetR/AcrR family transcriptional regulator [Solirubrobacterales bacterium]